MFLKSLHFSTVNKIRPCRLFSLTGQTENATKDILVISKKVHEPNSPLPKTLLTKIPTLTPIWSVIVTCSLNGSLTA